MRISAPVALAIAFAVASIAVPTAQGQRGRGGPPGRGGRAGGPAAPRPANGTVEKITVHGASLEGNLEGDSPDREVLVYLPPSYAADQMRRFPVVYLLHGYTGHDTTFTERLANLPQSGDKWDAAQGFSSAIYVMPDAFTLHKGSMYSNSPTIGNWEKFIAEDLVSYIDSHYRTLPTRMSRGLAGHSMGGYGALRIGMKRPDVFASLYLMSSCCLAATRTPTPDSMKEAEAIKTREQAEAAGKSPGFGASVFLSEAAAWSPNPNKPPLFLDLPVENGKVRPDIVAKWAENAPLETIDRYADNLRKYFQIGMEVGTKDPLLASNRQLDAAMTRLRIPHRYEEYEGDHTNHVRDRVERNLLPFFARNLQAPPNPTSPSAPADVLSTASK
jgi:enterochelin esterase-like enzyme